MSLRKKKFPFFLIGTLGLVGLAAWGVWRLWVPADRRADARLSQIERQLLANPDFAPTAPVEVAEDQSTSPSTPRRLDTPTSATPGTCHGPSSATGTATTTPALGRADMLAVLADCAHSPPKPCAAMRLAPQARKPPHTRRA